MGNNQARFDPIWRRIKSDGYTSKLEGPFRDARDRLGELNNWGSLGWLYPHATATKLAHHYGVEHNAVHYLSADDTRRHYETPFRIAAHALHWGHPPLSYAGAEGIVRAAHVDEKAQEVLEGILKEVVVFGSLNCAEEGHPCIDSVLQGERPFELYKWLSAWLVAKRWTRIWKAVKSLSSEQTDEAEVKKLAVRTLVCRESSGYEILDRCRLADYVPRDLQQAGTAWLSVDLEALWEVSPIRPDLAPEWGLLEASQSYLEERFFTSPDALLIHSLAGRVIAQGLLAQGVTKDSIHSLLTAASGDAHYFSEFADYHRRRLVGIRNLAKGEQLDREWEHLGTFGRVMAPVMSRLEVEDYFTGRKGSGRLSYPLSSNFSVFVEVDRRAFVRELVETTLTLHYRVDGDSKARPILDIAFDAQRRQPSFSRRDSASASIASWIAKERIALRPRELRRCAGKCLRQEADSAVNSLNDLFRLAALEPENDFSRRKLDLERATITGLPEFAVGRLALELPIAATRSKSGSQLIGLLRSCALKVASGEAQGDRGRALEVACAADQLLSPDPCTFRTLLLNPVALDDEGQPDAEWDIWRLDLMKGGNWRLVAAECAVAPNAQKAEKERERLDRLRASLQGRFNDLAVYKTRLVTCTGGELVYTDAARGFVRT